MSEDIQLIAGAKEVVETIEFWVKEQVEAMDIQYNKDGTIKDNLLLSVTIKLEENDG